MPMRPDGIIDINPLPKQRIAWALLLDHTTKYILFGGAAGGGKAQTMDSKVLTPMGFVRMGDIRIGDDVVTPSNEPAKVIAIHPQGVKEIYELEFKDGAKIRTTEEHLFECWIPRRRNSRKVRSVREMTAVRDSLVIPLSEPLAFGVHYDEIDSYTVGALLGDGGLTRNYITFTTEDEEIFNHLKLQGSEVRRKKLIQYSIVGGPFDAKKRRKVRLSEKMASLGLMSIRCEDRFVPDVLKNGSLENRLHVLQGLMDTDGYIDSRGHCEFSSKSRRLAEDVQYIVRSLGGKATLNEMRKSCVYKGERKWGTYYRVYIRSKTERDFFRLERKRSRARPFNGGISTLGRRVLSIRKVGAEEAQCITIDHPRGLYVSDDFVVTHNSWLICEWLIYMCYVYPMTKYFIGRNELKRLMMSTFETFKKVCRFHAIPDSDWRLDGQQHVIIFRNGSRIDLLDLAYRPQDPIFERLGSLEYTSGAIEEAGEVHFLAFDVLKTRVGRWMNKELGILGKLFSTANPKKNWLKRVFWKPWAEGTLKDGYAFVQSLFSDNHHTAAEYEQSLNEISNEAMRQRLRDGDWNYAEEAGTLIDSDALSDLFDTELDWAEDKWATLDVARFGADTSRLYLYRGWNCYKIVTWRKKPTDFVADEVKTILRDEAIHRSKLAIDEVGVGAGVLDQIKGARGFVANASPLEDPDAQPVTVMRNGKLVDLTPRENFATLKDQCGYRLAEMVNARLVAIDCDDELTREEIIEEVGQLRDAKPDEDGKKRLAPKDEIKEAIGRSPDHLDNLIMRVFLSLLPKKLDRDDHADEAQARRNRNGYGSQEFKP